MGSSEFYRNVYGAMAEGHFQQRYVAAQRGNGFFGRIIKGSIMPMIKAVLPYLKDVALDGVGGLVDELKAGKSVKEASKNQLKRTSSAILNDMANRVQAGAGLRKRRKRSKKQRLKKRPRPKLNKAGKRSSAKHTGPFRV